MHRYFEESVAAARALGVRAMLVTNFPEQVPADLPSHVKTFGYLPFSDLLPHAAMLVYHGGIGTLAQTIKAGIPHLVVPTVTISSTTPGASNSSGWAAACPNRDIEPTAWSRRSAPPSIAPMCAPARATTPPASTGKHRSPARAT